MGLLETVCASCGETTRDSDWCDHCGAPLQVDEPTGQGWLEVGSVLTIQVPSELLDLDERTSVELTLRVEEMAEQFVNRRVFIGGLEEFEGEGQGAKALSKQALSKQAFLIEETAGRRSLDAPLVPESLRHRLRQPIYEGARGEHGISVFLDNAGISIEELVVLGRGELTLAQIKDVFVAILDSVEELHEARHAHLRLAPWTVRILDAHARDGFPGMLLQQTLDRETSKKSGLDEADSTSEAIPVRDHQDFGERGRTEVQLQPLSYGLAHDADDELGDEFSDEFGAQLLDMGGDEGVSVIADFDEGELDDALLAAGSAALSEASVFESEPLWHGESASDASDASEEAPRAQALLSIFDGIDEFFCLEEEIELNSVVMGYSPPEMLGRLRSPIGEAADIFSLGMLLYYLVSGQNPPASVYTRYAPALPVRNFRPGFPPGLQGIISRATRPSPQDRFEDIASMRQAFLEACEVMAMRSMASERPIPMMRLASDTHVGIAKRRRNPVNQDSVFSAISDDGKLSLIVVADGVSTASFGSGDLASAGLTRAAVRAWEDLLPTYLMDEEFDEVAVIQSLLNEANQSIVDYVNEHCTPFRGSPHEVMGSTAVVAIIHKGVVTLATLGDSRAYLQRGKTLEQLTIDHNLWTLSILEGVAADNALAMAHGDALARCLGTFVIDQGNLIAVPPQPDLYRFIVTGGDTLLLTTDGLVDFGGANALVAEDNILTVLMAEPDPALCCLELILLANRGGGGDNIGVSVIRFS